MTELNLDVDIELMTPKMYKIILHNDDYSTFDFVIQVLMEVFHKTQQEAEKLTFNIDQEGFAIVGIYPKEIAETKVNLVRFMAKAAEYPLLVTMEEE